MAVIIENGRDGGATPVPLGGASLTGSPSWSSRRYTQVSERHRRSGRDAGTQAQGCETIGWDVAFVSFPRAAWECSQGALRRELRLTN